MNSRGGREAGQAGTQQGWRLPARPPLFQSGHRTLLLTLAPLRDPVIGTFRAPKLLSSNRSLPTIPPAAFCSQSHTQQFPASLQKLPSVILIYLKVEKITFCPLLHLHKLNIHMQPPFSLWQRLPSGLWGCDEDLPMRWPLGRPPPEHEQPPPTATFLYGLLEAGSADPSSVLYSCFGRFLLVRVWSHCCLNKGARSSWPDYCRCVGPCVTHPSDAWGRAHCRGPIWQAVCLAGTSG